MWEWYLVCFFFVVDGVVGCWDLGGGMVDGGGGLVVVGCGEVEMCGFDVVVYL